MQLQDAIKIRLEYFMKRKNISSYWELYKASWVPRSTINALLSSNKTSIPKLPTLLHLCEGLGTNLVEFFSDSMFIDVEDTSEDKNDIK